MRVIWYRCVALNDTKINFKKFHRYVSSLLVERPVPSVGNVKNNERKKNRREDYSTGKRCSKPLPHFFPLELVSLLQTNQTPTGNSLLQSSPLAIIGTLVVNRWRPSYQLVKVIFVAAASLRKKPVIWAPYLSEYGSSHAAYTEILWGTRGRLTRNTSGISNMKPACIFFLRFQLEYVTSISLNTLE